MNSNIISFTGFLRYKGCDKMREIERIRMLEIENIVSVILKDVDFEKSPYVDIVSIVKKDGFEVRTIDMDINTTGYLLVNDTGKNQERLIAVNTFFKNTDDEEDVVFKKSRFITAHEYGHFILHKEKGQPIFAHRDTYHRTEQIELDADYFARSILMPLHQFKIFYDISDEIGKGDKDFTLLALSKIFKVTKNKVNKRMEDLLILNQ